MSDENIDTASSMYPAPIKILLVDHDVETARVHEKIMGYLGVQVEVQIVTESVPVLNLYFIGKRFDIIFIDRDMPDMNAHALTRELRSAGLNSLVVGITGIDISEEKIKAFKAAGLNDCIMKPLTVYDIHPLLERIRRGN